MGSKAVFGVLLIGFGIILAYLAITGTLGKVWALLTTSSLPPAAPAASSNVATADGAPTPQNNTIVTASMPHPSLTTSVPTFVQQNSVPATSNEEISNVNDPAYTAAQIAAGVNEIQQLESYNPSAMLPSSATVNPVTPISSLSSVYSQTLASQSGVTGIVS